MQTYIDDKELYSLVEKIYQDCEAWLMSNKSKPRPVVGLPMARVFNETVAMDLKCYDFNKNVWLLHLIDHATRFSASCVLNSKKKELIIKIIQ